MNLFHKKISLSFIPILNTRLEESNDPNLIDCMFGLPRFFFSMYIVWFIMLTGIHTK